MIVAAAQLAGCTVLYSEDMHDGLVVEGLAIRNPYTGA
jgi:predicted nucleic acid-binding protein